MRRVLLFTFLIYGSSIVLPSTPHACLLLICP
jgi:hypothetical protein